MQRLPLREPPATPSTRPTHRTPQGGGKVIRAWRRRRKLTQKELAAEAGLTPGDISGLERGERALTLEIINKISAALKVESRDLEQEIAWANRQKLPQASPEELNLEALAASWDVVADRLKPYFLEAVESFLREKKLQARRKGNKP